MANSARNPSNRRRQYYIKKRFQLRFILQFCSLIILGCGAFGLAVYLYSTQALTAAFVHSKLRVMSTANFLLPALFITALVVTTMVAFAAAIRLLLLSHKIAGPLYRLEKSAQEIGSGNLNFQVKLRSGDELQDFARSMDAMVTDLRIRAGKIKKQAERLRGLNQQAQKASIPSDILRELKDIQDQLDAAAGDFQV